MAVYLNFHPSSSLWVLYIVKLQLILKTKTTYPLALHYLVLRGPFGDMKVDAKIHKFEFTDQENESPYVHLPLVDTAECNRLLAAKVINFRYVDSELYFGTIVVIQGVSKRALQLWKLIEIYTEDIHNVLNCQNVAKHTEF